VIIIGNGPDYEKYKSQIHQLGIQNEFFLVGALKDSYKYIKAFDVFTLSSHFEGLSISLIEAIFAEIPVLASDVGGNKEIVGNSSEQVYILNDIDDYIKKLLEIKRNRPRFIEFNATLKKDFALEKMVSKYKSLYDSLIGGSKP
jgi:glycosyltransferase involved in cell wall biosynthesis